MRSLTKQIIENCIEFIDENRFDAMYDTLAQDEPAVWSHIGEVTQVLLRAGINPLNSLHYVPEFYLSNTEITTFTIPTHIDRILENAFDNCHHLKSILLPKNLKLINRFAFDSCYSLESIKIPASVQAIGKGAFSSCGLTTFAFPEGIDRIAIDVLSGCPDLTSVYIPASVELIEEHAFEDDEKLTLLYYGGTKDQWYNIDKEVHWCRKTPLDTIICTDGKL